MGCPRVRIKKIYSGEPSAQQQVDAPVTFIDF